MVLIRDVKSVPPKVTRSDLNLGKKPQKNHLVANVADQINTNYFWITIDAQKNSEDGYVILVTLVLVDLEMI
jgi:hypothetical protein